MRALICRVLGHRYKAQHHPRFYVCQRCLEPGFGVPLR